MQGKAYKFATPLFPHSRNSNRPRVQVGSHAPVLHLCSDTVIAGDHVRVLGVTFSSDLSLEKQR